MTSANCRTMQVIFLKILSSSAAIVATFMTLSTLLMMNLLNSSGRHADRSGPEGGTGGWSVGHHRTNAGRQIMTLPSEDHTLSAFDDLVATVWNPADYRAPGRPLPACRTDLPLLVLVTSAPDHQDRRKAIRETWARDWTLPDDNRTAWRTIFLIGRSPEPALDALVAKESALYGDILMGDYVDSYRNLTVKVQYGMAWALQYCRPQFLLKTDDDCFVNAKALTGFLTDNSQGAWTGLYAGFAVRSLEVVRDEKSRWYISRESYRPSRFLPYASGTGYVVSTDVLQAMVRIAPYVRPFAAEDAYAGLLAHYADVTLLDSSRFALNNVNWRLCNYLFLLVVHNVTPDQQILGLRYSIEALSKCKNQPIPKSWN